MRPRRLNSLPHKLTQHCRLAFEEILRIGFLNDRVAERLAEYQSRFDVVIVGDPDVSFVVGLLQEIVGGGNGGDGGSAKGVCT